MRGASPNSWLNRFSPVEVPAAAACLFFCCAKVRPLNAAVDATTRNKHTTVFMSIERSPSANN